MTAFLSVDASSPVFSAAFVRFEGPGDPVVEFRRDMPLARSDSTGLFSALEEAVRDHGKPDALVTGLGPGSYNGLRSAIASMRAMGTALAIPLHGVPSPLAMPVDAAEFLVAGDARGGSLWVARVGGGAFLQEPALISPDDLAALREREPSLPLAGPAPLTELHFRGGFRDLIVSTPDAVRLAIVARRNDPFYSLATTPEPLYLKPPHITAPRPRTATA
jgi:tRNA threonylcarbamoyl adenosine modification protein YeaZ